ncbi:MAG: PKD domain-containing protein [Bacteroidales bacterium]|nr:PKD domain-containing protein [Bacteroidales bacterium]
MKRLLNLFCLTCLLFTFSTVFGQNNKNVPARKWIYDQLDPRVDNMSYWMTMAEKGLTPYNPDIPLPPAIFKGSQIRAHGVRTTNSPDVPVTNLTNVTESENSVFIDPNNANYILNSNNSTSWSGSTVGSVYGANYFQSSNAGIGWVGTPNGAGGTNRGDPTTAIGLNGREYVNFISSGSGQGIAYSDNGTSWSTASIAPNPGTLADKNHMWIDNKITSPYEGNLYVAWTDFGGTYNYQVLLSRSIDDGATWSAKLPVSGSISTFNHGVNLQTGPGGEVYAIWATYPSSGLTEEGIGFTKSLDGGVTFSTATKIISNIRGIRETGVQKNMRVNSFPVMAADISGGPNNGNIYVVWTNIGIPGINTGTNKSVYIIRSVNGGTSWSTPVRVNQGTYADGKEAYFPWISCDPVTGVLTVVFYDDRNVSSTQCEVFTAYSTDAGTTWTDFQVSDVAFTPTAIPGLASSYMGDYLGITSKGGKVYPCWTDNRGGIFMTYVSPFELGLNADFFTNSTTICTGSGVTFTDVSTGPPISWTWSFPGGTPSSYIGQTPPAITYSAPGSYDVSLTVSDGVTFDTETKTGFITVKNVIAGFTGAPTTVVVGNTVTFTDNSLCGPATWTWSFPGGSPASFTGQTPPAILYNTLGTYDVSLTVTKPGGSDTKTRTGYISVVPPIFNIANGTVTTCTGDFYDSGGPADAYQNNETFTETFYPSTPGAMMRFTFTSFSTELDYDTLTIYNGINTSAPIIGKYHGTTGPGTVTASNPSGALTFRFYSDAYVTAAGWAASISCYSITDPPVADFSASTTTPVVGQTVTFTDLSSNAPTSWAWSFNPPTVTYVGGTTASSKNPQVQFSALGMYTVTLTATNAYGSDAEIKTNYINVTNCTYTTLPFTENFPGTTIPNCWSQVDNQGNGQVWEFGVITGQSPNPALTGNYAYLDSDTYGNGNSQNADLISPTLNLSAYTGITLQFSHYFKSYSGSSGTLSYSINNGSTWAQIQQFTTTSASNPVTFNQVLPALAGQPQVKFKWNYTGSWGWYWGIDNIQVTGTCISTLPVSVSISASANPVDQGVPVTFNAIVVNGGTSPVYQWKINNINVGTNAGSYQYIPSDGDLVSCVLTSNAACVSGNPATSNVVTMTVNSVPVNLTVNNITVTGTQCFNAVQTIFVAGSGNNFSVVNGGNATMIAGQNILYYPGTTVEPGGYLYGYIAPGGPFCNPPTKPAVLTGNNEKSARLEKDFFRIYPNPTTGEFTLALNGYVPSEKISVAVYDMNGGIVLSGEITDEMKHVFSLSGKPAGLYLIRVISGNQHGSSRIIKGE